MHNYIRILTFLLLLGGWTNSLFAQQETMYTQYMFNGMVLNPAYAGSHESISATLLSRVQWAGVEGAPRSQSFSIHSPIGERKMAIGVNFTNDRIGVSYTQTMNFATAYRLRLRRGMLSFGLQGGLYNYTINYSDLITDPNDPAYQIGNIHRFTPNVGAGVFFNSKKLYIGFSVPKMLSNSFETGAGLSYAERNHYFLTSGYVFTLSDNLILKPNVLLRGVQGAPFEVDLNINALLQKRIWLGVSYRKESVDLITELQINDNFRLGYAFDIITNDLNKATTGSHEFMLNYRLIKKKNKIITPRYF